MPLFIVYTSIAIHRKDSAAITAIALPMSLRNGTKMKANKIFSIPVAITKYEKDFL